jgi:ribosomal protein L3 glutamine methyltransferase
MTPHFDNDMGTLVTLRDWLRYAVSRFSEAGLAFGHGSDNAFDEAAYLIQHTLHLPPDRLEPFLDARLTENEREAVAQVLWRRVSERLPAAYLTHEAWLGDFRFYVDDRVLIPRSFIAELLRERLSPWIENADAVTSALDLCTGCGCLAIVAASVFPNARVDAADVSQEALAVAARNVADYALTERIELIESDLFEHLSGRRYDLILSNPPYVDAKAMAQPPQEYRHEPASALAGGTDGLDFVRTILHKAAEHLNPGGLLMLEIGHNRAALEAAFPELPFTWPETSAGADFVVLIARDELAGLPG